MSHGRGRCADEDAPAPRDPCDADGSRRGLTQRVVRTRDRATRADVPGALDRVLTPGASDAIDAIDARYSPIPGPPPVAGPPGNAGNSSQR